MGVQKMVIAVDVDGTLYDGSVSPTRPSLRCARRPLTVTRWSSSPAGAGKVLGHVVPDAVASLTDRVVCEEGGVMVDVAAHRDHAGGSRRSGV